MYIRNYVCTCLNISFLLTTVNENINCVTLILQLIARHKGTDAAAVATDAKQDYVQHLTTTSGEKYALPNKPPAKQQGVSICIHVHMYVHVIQISHSLSTTHMLHDAAKNPTLNFATLK